MDMKNRKLVCVSLSAGLQTAALFMMALVAGLPASAQKMEWKFQSQRPEIAPASYVDSKITFGGKPTLVLAGDGKDYAAGCWSKTVDAQAGAYYTFRTHFKSSLVDEPARSILARVV